MEDSELKRKCATIYMTFYVKRLLEYEWKAVQEYSMPGKRDSFQINNNVVARRMRERFFHTVVANILKNGVSIFFDGDKFLCTRAARATDEDLMNL